MNDIVRPTRKCNLIIFQAIMLLSVSDLQSRVESSNGNLVANVYISSVHPVCICIMTAIFFLYLLGTFE